MLDGGAAKALAVCASVSLVGKFGDAVAPLLLTAGWPYAMLVLNASDANLALTAGIIRSTSIWLLVLTARRVAEDTTYFLLGRNHGVIVAEQLLSVDMRAASKRWNALSLVALFVFPSSPVCILAGASERSPWSFVIADICATLLRACAILALSHGVSFGFGFEPAALLTSLRSLVALHHTVALALTTACSVPGILGAASLLRRSGVMRGPTAQELPPSGSSNCAPRRSPRLHRPRPLARPRAMARASSASPPSRRG